MQLKKQESKSNIYGNLLMFVLLMLLTVIFTSESGFIFKNINNGVRFGGLIYSFFQAGFMLYAAFLLKRLNYPKRVVNIIYILVVVGLIITLLITNPFLDVLSLKQKQYFFSLCHVLLIIGEVLLARVILIDIFRSSTTHTDHIWGAIIVYLIIIYLFSEVYEILTLFNPGLLGQEYLVGWPKYVQCIMFSMNSITGMDLIYPDSHNLLKKLGTLENLIGNLFLVVILGRLLSHPLQAKTKD